MLKTGKTTSRRIVARIDGRGFGVEGGLEKGRIVTADY
jgi:hypothetical protein